MSGFLHKPHDDLSTYAGSVMLDNLRNELAKDLQGVVDASERNSIFMNSNADDFSPHNVYKKRGYFIDPAELNDHPQDIQATAESFKQTIS